MNKPGTKIQKKDEIELRQQPTDELVKVEPGGLMEAVPDYLMQEHAALGVESMRPKDIAIARLMLAQQMSAAVDKQNESAYIEGLEPGMFYNGLTRENYGNKIYIVPLMSLPKRLYMRPMEDGGGVLCRSEDGNRGEGEPGGVCAKCILSTWKQGVHPECDEVLTYHALVSTDEEKPFTADDWVVWGAKVSALKAARYLNRLYALRVPRLDLFAGRYKITSFYDQTQKKPCWVPVVENAGWVTKQQANFARKFFLSVSSLERAGRFKTLGDEAEEPQVEVV
jgi:hypothetical protein